MKMYKIHDFSGIPDFQWNAPQKHQEIVTFIKGSGVGPGEARSAQGPWRSTRCVSLQQKTPTTYWLSCFSWRFGPFRRRCEKPWYSYRIIEVSAVPFPAKSSFHGNHDFLWNAQISMKITGFRQKPRFSRKCWFRRKTRLENTKKLLRLQRVLAPAAGEVGFSRKTW